MGEIVTFYSYKGGVGRSMALANVGHIMACQMQPRRKVLMIDWDLEAPGLHRFFYEQLRTNFAGQSGSFDRQLNGAPGLIEFLNNIRLFYEKVFASEKLSVMYAETPEAEAAFEKALAAYPFDQYVLDVAPTGPASDPQQLFLLKAGDQASGSYVNLVRSFPWQTFFDSFGSFFPLFCRYLAEKYDTVLIDSRTGLTDIGDICTRVMPEKLVGVFVPNEQNITGLGEVLTGAAAFRLASRDPRGLMIYPLASRIDPSRGTLRRTWWQGGRIQNRDIAGYQPRFEKLVSELYQLDECKMYSYFNSTQVPHDGDYAFGEEVAARDPSSGRFGIDYSCRNLAEYLTEDRVPWEPLPSTEPVTEPIVTSAPRALPTPVETHPQRRLFEGRAAIVLGVIGIIIGTTGPLLQSASLGNPAQQVASVSVGNVVVTATPAAIAGYGVGTSTVRGLPSHGAANAATNQASDTAAKLPAVPVVLALSMTHGTVSPSSIVVDLSDPEKSVPATVTSAGYGPATLKITSSAGGASVGAIDLLYGFPLGLLLAALGGALAGHTYAWARFHSLELASLRRGLPSLHSLELPSSGPPLDKRIYLPVLAMHVTFGLLTVAFYAFVVAPLVSPSLRFDPTLIMLIAALGTAAIPHMTMVTERMDLPRK